MQRAFLILAVASSLVEDSISIAAGAAKPLEIGDRVCLFFDDHFIAEQSDLKRTWHQGRPHPTAVIAETEPNDHWIQLHGSCFYDPEIKRYRMYYQSTQLPSGVPGVSFLDLVCYAESKDGMTWVKPKLGLVEFRGSKDNNIVLELAGPPNVFIDPLATDPAKRLRMLTYLTKGRGPTEGHNGLAWLTSGDGFQWTYESGVNTPTFADPAEAMFNDLFIVTWDDRRQKFRGNWRGFSKHTTGNLQGNRRRAIGQTFSTDLRQWTPSVTIVRPDEGDDRKAAAFGKEDGAPDWGELYIMPAYPYGNHYLGLVTVFCLVDAKDLNGGGDLQLCFSNDGESWHRQPDRQTAMAPGDDPALVPCFAQFNPPLEIGNETWIFYSESNGVHGIQDWQKSRSRIRAGVWRRDGFVSLDAAERGTLTTQPLAFTGKELRLNFDTQDSGIVRVGMLDRDGQPIPGYGLDECRPLTGDAVSGVVRWNAGADVAKLNGKVVRLKFDVSRGRLWSFRFAS